MVSQIKENLEKTHQKLEDYLQKNHFFPPRIGFFPFEPGLACLP
jgi:hypothetical protein